MRRSNFLLLFFVLLSELPSFSQNILISLKDGSTSSIPVSQIKKFIFAEGSVCIKQTNGQDWEVFMLNNLEAIQFSLSTNLKPYPSSDADYFNTNTGVLHLSDIGDNTLVCIYQMDGRIILKRILSKNEELNIQSLPKGMYFVKVNENGFKFLKP
jgi:hypothetical protein